MRQLTYLVLVTAFLLTSCTKKNPENLDEIIGTWELSSTSGGSHGMGYDAQFDGMIIHSDFTFELLDNSVSVAYGSIYEKISDTDDILVEFTGESDLPNLHDIIEDGEKYITFERANIINLIAPCCDRFNSHWTKEL
ncbi:hypothetical protein N9B82_05500 [Saprospiraceae bacterium]|nr:hypothetical protein [Saprospiraceae bacterium]